MRVGPGLGRPAWLLSGGAGQSFFLGRSDQVWAAGMWRVTPHQPQVWGSVAPPNVTWTHGPSSLVSLSLTLGLL